MTHKQILIKTAIAVLPALALTAAGLGVAKGVSSLVKKNKAKPVGGEMQNVANPMGMAPTKIAGYFKNRKRVKAHNEYSEWFNQPENIQTINKHYSKAAKKFYNTTPAKLNDDQMFPAYQHALKTSGFNKIRENYYKKHKLGPEDIIL